MGRGVCVSSGGNPNQIFTSCSSPAWMSLNVDVASPNDSVVLFGVLG